jgi:hypothetical protein
MNICADKTVSDEDILKFCNLNNPSGTVGGWTEVIRDPNARDCFDKVDMGPVICSNNQNKLHLMVSC